MDQQENYQKAKKRVVSRVNFYVHLGVYLAVGILLLIINLSNSPEVLWFQWPMMGWGVGVLFHAAGTFLFSSGSETMNKMIEKELRKEEESYGVKN